MIPCESARAEEYASEIQLLHPVLIKVKVDKVKVCTQTYKKTLVQTDWPKTLCPQPFYPGAYK